MRIETPNTWNVQRDRACLFIFFSFLLVTLFCSFSLEVDNFTKLEKVQDYQTCKLFESANIYFQHTKLAFSKFYARPADLEMNNGTPEFEQSVQILAYSFSQTFFLCLDLTEPTE